MRESERMDERLWRPGLFLSFLVPVLVGWVSRTWTWSGCGVSWSGSGHVWKGSSTVRGVEWWPWLLEQVVWVRLWLARLSRLVASEGRVRRQVAWLRSRLGRYMTETAHAQSGWSGDLSLKTCGNYSHGSESSDRRLQWAVTSPLVHV